MNNRQEELNKILLCFETLNKALNIAHGSPMTIDRLANMTALDLLTLIGPNDILFVNKVLDRYT